MVLSTSFFMPLSKIALYEWLLWIKCLYLSQNSFVETLIPRVRVSGDGALRKKSGHEGEDLMVGLVPL